MILKVIKKIELRMVFKILFWAEWMDGTLFIKMGNLGRGVVLRMELKEDN